MRVSLRRRGQRCSRASFESLDSRAPGPLAAKVRVVKNFGGRGRPWKLPLPSSPLVTSPPVGGGGARRWRVRVGGAGFQNPLFHL